MYKTFNMMILFTVLFSNLLLANKKKLIFVKGGTFEMGSTNGLENEKPVHSVSLKSFYIGKYEVTQIEYKTIMGENPSMFKGDSLPVVKVSWWDAIKYCNKKSRKEAKTPCYNVQTGKCNYKANGYRLPTEAEWEYAAKGGIKSRGYKYSGSDTIDGVSWHYENSGGQPHKVGTKKPNELGIYDMSGNVFEWCNDNWNGNNYSSQIRYNPKGSPVGSDRIRRGGCYFSMISHQRSAFRFWHKATSRFNNTGFRVICN